MKDMVKLVGIPTIDLSKPNLRQAREMRADGRERFGFARISAPLLSQPDYNVKLNKNEVETFSLSLAQAETSGYNVCRWSTPACRNGCVGKTGKGSLPMVLRARLARTVMLAEHPNLFVSLLVHEIRYQIEKYSGNVAFRLNAFSDLPWEDWLPADIFTSARFYDYTKAPPSQRPQPVNYTLRRSVTERHNFTDVIDMMGPGEIPVMVVDVLRGHALPTVWRGIPVVDGDATDDRTLDLDGSIVMLRSKGRLRDNRANQFAKVLETF